jgi:hypothetical protein
LHQRSKRVGQFSAGAGGSRCMAALAPQLDRGGQAGVLGQHPTPAGQNSGAASRRGAGVLGQ